MATEIINISKYSTRPFGYTVGDTFKISLSFNYDVTTVLFGLIVYTEAGAVAKTYTNVDFVLSGTRKKTITKTPVQFNLVAGTYRLVLTHTFSDGTIRKRFDSALIIKP